jgi:hypothetical protein
MPLSERLQHRRSISLTVSLGGQDIGEVARGLKAASSVRCSTSAKLHMAHQSATNKQQSCA